MMATTFFYQEWFDCMRWPILLKEHHHPFVSVSKVDSATGREEEMVNTRPKDCWPCKLTPFALYLAAFGYTHYQRASLGKWPYLFLSTGCLLLAGHHLQKNILPLLAEEKALKRDAPDNPLLSRDNETKE